MTAVAPHAARTDDSLGRFLLGAFLPVLVGTVTFVLIYVGAPAVGSLRELAENLPRTPVQRAAVWLFCVGLASVGMRLVRASRVSKFLSADPLGSLERIDEDVLRTVDRVRDRLNAVPPTLRRTTLFTRLDDAVAWLRTRQSVAGLDDHLRERAEAAQRALYDGTAGVRMVIWGVMLLGFLGTVGELGAAVANVPPGESNAALPLLAGGLGAAFESTVVSLALSLALTFASFGVERVEQHLAGRADDMVARRFAPLFPSVDAPAVVPFQGAAEAESRAAEQILRRTETLIQRQAQLWEDALERTRERWTTTLDQQTEALHDALRSGMGTTLSSHSEQLALTREDFLNSFQQSSDRLVEAVTKALEQQDRLHGDIGESFDLMVRKASESLGAIQKDERMQIDALLRGLSERIAKWQSELRDGTEATRDITIEMRRQSETLLQIVAQEEELSRLQGRLTENLEALKATAELDEAVHSLNAAVHLLTAKARTKAA